MFNFHLFPHTRFRMHLTASNNLLIGEFSIHYEEHRFDVFPCSSGLRGYQLPEHYWTRGKGPLPPSIAVAQDYKLSTTGYWSRKVEGLFFHFEPDPIWPVGILAKDVKDDTPRRGEIGLHLDTHGPGTSGCEGIQGEDYFARIEELMAIFKAEGKLFLAHHVEYDL